VRNAYFNTHASGSANSLHRMLEFNVFQNGQVINVCVLVKTRVAVKIV